MSDTYLDIPASVSIELSSSTRLLSVIPDSTTATAREMLEKIYLACALDPRAEATTYLCSPPIALASEIATSSPGLRIAVFGLSPKQVGALWSASAYQWMKVGDHFWCFAERLEDIEADIDKKKQLWGCLKVLKTT